MFPLSMDLSKMVPGSTINVVAVLTRWCSEPDEVATQQWKANCVTLAGKARVIVAAFDFATLQDTSVSV
jgi:hypothetical protein